MKYTVLEYFPCVSEPPTYLQSRREFSLLSLRVVDANMRLGDPTTPSNLRDSRAEMQEGSLRFSL